MENYAGLLDREPPKELVEEMKGRAALKREYLIYRAARWKNPLTGISEKAVKVTCSACGESWYSSYVPGPQCARYAPAPFGFKNENNEDIISGDETICPVCGAEARAAHITHVGHGIEHGNLCMSFGRLGDRLVLYGWYIQRIIDKTGKSWWSTHPYEAYVYGEKEAVRLTGHQRQYYGIQLFEYWEQRKKWTDEWGETGLTYGAEDIPLEGSAVERSRLDLYLRDCSSYGITAWPASYMKLWQKHPQVENLLVQGAGAILADLLDRDRCRMVGYYGQHATGIPKVELNWKEKKPSKLLGLNKTELRAAARLGWTARNLEAYKVLRSLETVNLDDPGTADLIEKHPDWVQKIAVEGVKYRGSVTALRCCRYLVRQNERRTEGTKLMDAVWLVDYWRMADAAGWNLRDVSRLLPKDLRREHDKAMQESAEAISREKAKERAKEIAKRAPAFRKHTEALRKFAWEKDGILIRPCEDERELIREGELLHHCVATYASAIARGTSAIFFVRKAKEPDKPWFTLELDEPSLTVRQNRGSHNCARTDDVKAFEAAWLEHIHSLKEKKGADAA